MNDKLKLVAKTDAKKRLLLKRKKWVEYKNDEKYNDLNLDKMRRQEVALSQHIYRFNHVFIAWLS